MSKICEIGEIGPWKIEILMPGSIDWVESKTRAKESHKKNSLVIVQVVVEMWGDE